MKIFKRIRANLTRKWNQLKNKVRERLDRTAENLDASLNDRYPITTRFLTKIGITSQNILYETEEGIHYLNEKASSALSTTRQAFIDTARGFVDVASTFLPSTSSLIPSTLKAIFTGNLGQNFVRAVSLNGIMIGLGTFFLKWPELAYQYLLRKEAEREEPYGKGFYVLAIMNLYVGYKLSQMLAFKLSSVFYEDALNNTIINEYAANSEVRPILKKETQAQLAKLCEPSSLLAVDPRPKAIKNLIRSKIFSSTEATLKDLFVIGALLFNHWFIGSRVIEVGGWIGRAWILGKDLGTSQLISTGMANVHVNRIKGHRNFNFLGKGIAHFGLYEVIQRYYNHFLGVNNVFLNLVIASLVYKFSIVSNYMTKIKLQEADYTHEGSNLDLYIQHVLVDPVLNWTGEKLQKRINRKSEAGPKLVQEKPVENKAVANEVKALVEGVDVKTRVDTKVGKEQALKQKEEFWWNNLMKMKLTPAERVLLQIHAANLIYLFSTIKQKRSQKGQQLVIFLASFFPRQIKDVLKSIFEEITDERIDNVIRFLLIHIKSEFEEEWVSIQKEKKTSMEHRHDENLEDLVMPFSKEKIDEIHHKVAKSLKCWDAGIIIPSELDEQEDSDQLLKAVVANQYHLMEDSDSDDEDVVRTKVSAAQSAVEVFNERVFFAFKQVYHDLVTAETSADALKVLSTRAANGAASLREGIEANVPGGTRALKMMAVAGPIVGGPVVSALALSAVAAATVADQADTIKAGAKVINALDFGAESRSTEPSDVPKSAVSNATPLVELAPPPEQPVQTPTEHPLQAPQQPIQASTEQSLPAAAPAPEIAAQSFTPGYINQVTDYASATLSSLNGWLRPSEKTSETEKLKVS